MQIKVLCPFCKQRLGVKETTIEGINSGFFFCSACKVYGLSVDSNKHLIYWGSDICNLISEIASDTKKLKNGQKKKGKQR